MTPQVVVVKITRLEAAHLSGLVAQFAELVDGADSSTGDPAIDRLVPDAYAEADAAEEFRRLTESDLLDRRRDDAHLVLASLGEASLLPDDPDDPALVETVEVPLESETARAWLRTLAAVRLVLASRLGIESTDEHDPEDPRFGIYDWLGYRLDGLVRALDDDA